MQTAASDVLPNCRKVALVMFRNFGDLWLLIAIKRDRDCSAGSPSPNFTILPHSSARGPFSSVKAVFVVALLIVAKRAQSAMRSRDKLVKPLKRFRSCLVCKFMTVLSS
jgi:hypothetical protein